LKGTVAYMTCVFASTLKGLFTDIINPGHI